MYKHMYVVLRGVSTMFTLISMDAGASQGVPTLELVDTLFKVEQFLGVFCYSDSCRDSVKTGVVEGFVVFQHAMDSMQ